MSGLFMVFIIICGVVMCSVFAYAAIMFTIEAVHVLCDIDAAKST